jgi:hypothetical protein
MHYPIAQLNKQLTRARTLFRQMSRTMEDIEDAVTIERAQRANWQQIPYHLGAGKKGSAVGLMY